MFRKAVVLFLFLSGAAPISAVAALQPDTQRVDDKVNPSSVVVTNHNPVFSWQFINTVSSFTIIVSSDISISPPPILWNYAGSTDTTNTINFVTRVPFNTDTTAADALEPYVTYYWMVTLFDNGLGTSATGYFMGVPSSVTLPDAKIDLAVDWNNPFDPTRNQTTVFRFVVKDRDRRVRLRLFTLSGELVRDWPEQSVLKDAWYSESWDGKNADGEVVAQGIYLVNLTDSWEAVSVTRKVAVVKQ